MSARVMQVLESMAPALEQYSIDEAFMSVGGIERAMSFETFGRQVRQAVFANTGLTVGVGVAATKTLAKICNHAAKTWPATGGVVALNDPHRLQKLLSILPIDEVWGVGRQLTKKLNIMGYKTALDLSRADTRFIRENFNVVLERTVRELRGEACLALDEAPPLKQQIVSSRSFGERIKDIDAMQQAICQYGARAAEKLRQERQFCRCISVFIRSSPYAINEVHYGNIATERLLTPTQDTRDIVAAAQRALRRIWRDGVRYMKAGVMLNDFSGKEAQWVLFDDLPPRPNSAALMSVLDRINQSGRGQIWFAGQGVVPSWQMKRQMLSPAYTTRWNELPTAVVR